MIYKLANGELKATSETSSIHQCITSFIIAFHLEENSII